MVIGLLCGVIAAIVGALIWMGVAITFHLELALVAILIGFMVGFSIRLGGHGGSPVYGIMGALLTLAGCLGGEILTSLYEASTDQHSMLDLARSSDYSAMVQTIFARMNFMGYVIYAIGIYEGYKFSIRK